MEEEGGKGGQRVTKQKGMGKVVGPGRRRERGWVDVRVRVCVYVSAISVVLPVPVRVPVTFFSL